MKDRILLILQVLNVSQAEFCRQTGIPTSRVNELLNGKIDSLSVKTIAPICDAFGIDAYWLLTGNGTMFQGNKSNIVIGNNNFTNSGNITLTPEEEAIVEAMRKAKRRKGIINAIKALLGLTILIAVTRWIG